MEIYLKILTDIVEIGISRKQKSDKNIKSVNNKTHEKEMFNKNIELL